MLINVITSSGPLNLMPIIIIALLIIATINGSLSYNCLLVTQLICPLSSHFKRYRHIRILLHLHRSLYSFERCLGGSNTPQGDILFRPEMVTNPQDTKVLGHSRKYKSWQKSEKEKVHYRDLKIRYS
ncbi:hypothetical protein B9Z55_023553 [Caenorhabditis nigoni]|uniref:Uncharacterized protein n=1 Tax=Caenorhabditis nigoni TaxID=1611254 RepID=A0A2G5SQ46_9PELO|nr:hypothetical protein B9Z55_023553 [Caenorhabditis nigoni]